jgi:hypothetical protein
VKRGDEGWGMGGGRGVGEVKKLMGISSGIAFVSTS